MASCLGNLTRSQERKVLYWGLGRLLLIPLISWALFFFLNGISFEEFSGSVRITFMTILISSALLAPA